MFVSPSFVHLHVHSTFSDGTATPAQLVSTAVARGYSALALTDHNTLDGLPNFRRAAAEWDLAAIGGAECVVSSRHGSGHTLLLFADRDVERTFSVYLKHKSVLRIQELARIPGLYVTSACFGGLVAGAMRLRDYWTARDTALEFADLLGDRYFLEVQPSFGAVLPWILSLGRDCHIPVIATNDVHYLGLAEAPNQIGLHLATTSEMASYSPFLSYQGALENAAQVAQRLIGRVPAAVG